MARDFSEPIRFLCFPENLRESNLSAMKRADRQAHLRKHRLAFRFSLVQRPPRDWLRAADLRVLVFLRSPVRELPAEFLQSPEAEIVSFRALTRTVERLAMESIL